MSANKKTQNLRQQIPGRGNNHTEAVGSPKLAQPRTKRHNGNSLYVVQNYVDEPFTIKATGRIQWALERLLKAGVRGLTPITEPAPRWSAYVFSLREMGVAILTQHEPHSGEFPGHHGRYFLKSNVQWAAKK